MLIPYGAVVAIQLSRSFRKAINRSRARRVVRPSASDQILTKEAEAQANALQTAPRGLLRVAVPVSFGLQHVAPAVSSYMARYPEVNFDIAVSDRFVNLIEEGFDLAIRVGPLGDSNLIARQLVSAERSNVCASPAYLERAGRPQTPADLSSHSCLIYAEMFSPDTWQFEAPDGRSETVRVAGRFTCTNAGFVREMALAGHGILRGPSFWLSADIATGRLVTLLEPWRSPRELPVHALYPHRSLLSTKVRTLVDFLVEWHLRAYLKRLP
ncbi:MAG TPA: substrate binding domain-containing protein, partial [Stellaceae bacterium]